MWWSGLLGLTDLAEVDPGRGGVLLKMHQLATTKSSILSDDSMTEEEKQQEVESLLLDGAKIEDLGLTFQYSPSSGAYGYQVDKTGFYPEDFKKTLRRVC